MSNTFLCITLAGLPKSHGRIGEICSNKYTYHEKNIRLYCHDDFGLNVHFSVMCT